MQKYVISHSFVFKKLLVCNPKGSRLIGTDSGVRGG
jgi:hypothetical protein